MNSERPVVLVVGATGRTGRLVVEAAARHGLQPRALARDPDRAGPLVRAAEVVKGDLEDVSTLTQAVSGIDAVIFAHGSDHDARPDSFERIDYGGVAHLLRALDGRRPRIVLLSTFFVTHRDHAFNDGGHALDWKRRSERLVRASGAPHTIVRPGWLDQTATGDDALVLEQGDLIEAGVTRRQVAQTVVRSLLTDTAIGKTFELFAAPGPATQDWARLFATLKSDTPGRLDAIDDPANLPLNSEPDSVQTDINRLRKHSLDLTNRQETP
jgi:uncharacterized protein YbjT (DUF2867 family)